MPLLKHIDNRPLDSNIALAWLNENLYVVEHEITPLSFLRAGARIWVKMTDNYKVCELQKSWNRKEVPLDHFMRSLCFEVGENSPTAAW